MSKNKFGVFNVGDDVLFQEIELTIISKEKGNKTNMLNKQNGIITGNKSNPCLYTLSNGIKVRGNKLIKNQK